MSIAEAFKQSINNAFIHTIFLYLDKWSILKTFNVKVHGSANVTIIPPIQNIKIERIDETHDKVTFIYDDYTFVGVITWKPCVNGMNFVFMNIE